MEPRRLSRAGLEPLRRLPYAAQPAGSGEARQRVRRRGDRQLGRAAIDGRKSRARAVDARGTLRLPAHGREQAAWNRRGADVPRRAGAWRAAGLRHPRDRDLFCRSRQGGGPAAVRLRRGEPCDVQRIGQGGRAVRSRRAALHRRLRVLSLQRRQRAARGAARPGAQQRGAPFRPEQSDPGHPARHQRRGRNAGCRHAGLRRRAQRCRRRPHRRVPAAHAHEPSALAGPRREDRGDPAGRTAQPN